MPSCDENQTNYEGRRDTALAERPDRRRSLGRVALEHRVIVPVLRGEPQRPAPRPDAVDMELGPALWQRDWTCTPALRLTRPDPDTRKTVEAARQEAPEVRGERASDLLLGKNRGRILGRRREGIDHEVGVASLEVVVPFLHDLGDRWERGEASVAQEHFAASVIRGRMLGLARGWGLGVGPLAVIACLAGEQHDLGALAFGLALRSRGWRISYFGANTPLETIEHAADLLKPRLIVVAAVTDDRVRPVASELAGLAGKFRVALGGAAVHTAELNADVLRLGGDPVAEAERVTALIA